MALDHLEELSNGRYFPLAIMRFDAEPLLNRWHKRHAVIVTIDLEVVSNVMFGANPFWRDVLSPIPNQAKHKSVVWAHMSPKGRSHLPNESRVSCVA
jgi:hypothetical protein